MDGGLFHGKPYEQMDDLGGKQPLFLVQHPYTVIILLHDFVFFGMRNHNRGCGRSSFVIF